MNRIDRTFQALKTAGRKGLVGYLTAGDPDEPRSERSLREAIANGLDVLELGVPFSDPTADGPIIQEAARRALDAGMNLTRTLELVRRLRRDVDTPIVLFGYTNPFFRYGYEALVRDAADAGVDGLLVVDLPREESAELQEHLRGRGLYLIRLVAPTTPEPRMAEQLRDAEGFIYYIMVRGVTGAREGLAGDLAEHVAALRRHTDRPIAAGFGVGNGGQARAVARTADAVVVGSALVRAAREGRLGALVSEIAGALRENV